MPDLGTVKACARCSRPHTYDTALTNVSGMRDNSLGLPTRVVHVFVDREHTGTQVYCLDCWFDAGAPRTIEL